MFLTPVSQLRNPVVTDRLIVDESGDRNSLSEMRGYTLSLRIIRIRDEIRGSTLIVRKKRRG